MEIDHFAPWLSRWTLVPDGVPFKTDYESRLLPVLYRGEAAILKVASGEEEKKGGVLLDWYRGQGAVKVFEREGPAILLERAMGARRLSDMARNGDDDEATRILCATAAVLHAPRSTPPPETLAPLPVWFRALPPIASKRGGIFGKSWQTARQLLDDARDVTVLHGDIHHENVLDGGARGWLVIDPKGLIGERGYDYANMLCNPDAATALAPGRLQLQARIVSQQSGLEPQRLMQWLLAYCGLSAAWSLGDGHDAAPAIAIAELAAAELGL
jgi:streptomycin 6-kinase